MQRCLAGKHGINNSTRGEEHEDQHVQERRWGTHSRLGPVSAPLHDNADDEITEDGLEEDNLGDELGPDVHGSFEMDVVGNLETNGESHLEIIVK